MRPFFPYLLSFLTGSQSQTALLRRQCESQYYWTPSSARDNKSGYWDRGNPLWVCRYNQNWGKRLCTGGQGCSLGKEMQKKCFKRTFRMFYRNKVLHMGRIITCGSIGWGLTVWIAALSKRAGGPGTEAEGGSAIKANRALWCISKSVATRLVKNIIFL